MANILGNIITIVLMKVCSTCSQPVAVRHVLDIHRTVCSSVRINYKWMNNIIYFGYEACLTPLAVRFYIYLE